MKEQQALFDDNPKVFLFVTSKEREKQACVALDSIQGITVFPEAYDTTRVIPDEEGVLQTLTGVEISGVCAGQECVDVLNTLSENQIAGYNRVSQVIFHDLVAFAKRINLFHEEI